MHAREFCRPVGVGAADMCEYSVIKLTQPLAHRHYSACEWHGDGRTNTLQMRGEVALLSRRITVRSAFVHEDSRFGSLWHREYGARVRAFSSADREGVRSGPAPRMRMEEVEVQYAGHAGSAAVAFEGVGSRGLGSYLRDCLIHDAYSEGILVHASHHVELTGNVIFNTLGSNAKVTESHNVTLTRNLAMMASTVLHVSIFGRRSRSSIKMVGYDDYIANFDISSSGNHLIQNIASGSDGMGYKVRAAHRTLGLSHLVAPCPP